MSSTTRPPGITSDQLAVLGGLAVAGVGAFILGQHLLGRVSTLAGSQAPALRANTCVAVICAGVALALAARTIRPSRAANLLTAVPLLVGLATLAEYASGTDWGIDQLLVEDTFPPQHPGRMGLAVAFNLVAMGAAILGLRFRSPAFSQTTAVVVLASALSVITGHWYGTPAPWVTRGAGAVAALSAVLFLTLAAGIVCARRIDGIVDLLLRPTAASRLARWLVPTSLLAPLLIGRLLLLGAGARWYEESFISAAFALIGVGGGVGLTLATTSWLNHFESERHAIARELVDATAETQEKASYLAAIVDASDDAIVGQSVDGIVRSWNSGAARLYGYTAEEMIGADVFRLVPSEHQEEFRQVLALARRGDPVRSLATERVRKDGARIDVSLTLSPIRDGSGIVGLSEVARDVTALVQAQEAFRESSEFNRQILASVRQGVGVQDRNLRYVLWNESATRLTATPAWEVMGKTHREAFPDSGVLGVEELFAASLRGEATASLDIPQSTPESWIEVSVSPLRDTSGVIVGVISVLTDISGRKAAENDLRESLTFNRQIIASLDEALSVQDRERRFTLWNPAAERLTGRPAAETVGQIGEGMFEAADQPGLKELVVNALMDVPNPHLDVRVLNRRTGRENWASLSVMPLRDVTGAVVGAISVAVDMTERRSLEAQLQQAQKMEAIGQLAGGIAHDFNNLLTAILGYGRLLAPELTNPDHRRDIDQIVKAGERAAALTKQLLAFSRRQIIQPTVIDLNAVVQDIAPMLRRLIGEAIELKTTLVTPLARVHADRGQLEQVIMNLAVNARDAMPEGGRIWIETAETRLDAESLRTAKPLNPGRYVVLAVSDSGHGMSDEVKARLFEPFFTTKPLGKGTGLGLATVYGIVQQSGGHVSVYSQRGEGSTFKVYLPVLTGDGAAATATAAAAARARQGGSEAVLVVEDEDAVRALTMTVLERAGYQVAGARGPLEAETLFHARDGRFDALVTDIVMAGGTGLDLYRRLRNVRPALRALFMSGYTGDVAIEKENLDRHAAFLPKPFAADVLLEKLREVLDQ